jgi:hypothetical protein
MAHVGDAKPVLRVLLLANAIVWFVILWPW